MTYVDGFVLPVKKRQLATYRSMAKQAGKIWRRYGALEFRECVADDVPHGKRTSFPRSVKLKRGEIVVFSYIVYRSHADRDRVMAKVMKDKRIDAMMKSKKNPVRRQTHDRGRVQDDGQRVTSRRTKGSTMKLSGNITPCLWFDTQAEEAANFYCSVFENAKVGKISPKAGQQVHRKPPGSVMVVEFEINGQTFTALNGGPNFKFNEAVSFQVRCETQAEVDYYWSKLTQGGEEGPYGWIKDKYGLSWQIVPAAIPKMMTDPDPAKSERVMNAFLKMKKLDIAAIERAYAG